MAIPKYNELYSLFLFAIQDGAPHSSKDVKKIISQKLQLTALLLNWQTYIKSARPRFFPGQALCILTL